MTDEQIDLLLFLVIDKIVSILDNSTCPDTFTTIIDLNDSSHKISELLKIKAYLSSLKKGE